MSQAFWIPDNRNLLVRAIDSSGVISTPAITCTDQTFLDEGGFAGPWSMAADSLGHVFVLDQSAGVVYMIDMNTLVMTRVAGYGTSPGTGALAQPFPGDAYTLCCDASGNIFIGEPSTAIWGVNLQVTTQVILGVTILPGDIAMVAGTGTPGYSGDGGAATSAQVDGCYGMCFDASGNLYFADQGNERIRKVDTSGTITTVVGSGSPHSPAFSGDGGSPTSAELNAPLAVHVDSAGNLYICDTGNKRIRVVNNSGSTQTFFGVSIANGVIDTVYDFGMSANLWFSALDLSGRLLVNNVPSGVCYIQALNTDGSVSVVAGTGTPGYSGDGGAATSALIGEAFGLALVSAAPPPPGTGNIVVIKRTNPATSALKMFAFTPSWGSGFSLHDGQSIDSGPIVTGSYSIAETAVAGWSSSAVVSSGDPINALNLADGQTITVTFTNSPTISTISTLAKVYPWVS